MMLMTKKKAAPQRHGESVTVWIESDIKQATVAFVESHEPKTTLRGVIELALKEFLERRGQWPPKS